MASSNLVDSLLELAGRQVINAPGDDAQAQMLILEAAKRIEDLEEVARFYADQATWAAPRHWGSPPAPASLDRGARAREVLAGRVPPAAAPGTVLEALQFYACAVNYPPANTSPVALDRGARARAVLPLLERRTEP